MITIGYTITDFLSACREAAAWLPPAEQESSELHWAQHTSLQDLPECLQDEAIDLLHRQPRPTSDEGWKGWCLPAAGYVGVPPVEVPFPDFSAARGIPGDEPWNDYAR